MVAALEPADRRAPPARVDPPHVGRGPRELERVGVALAQLVYDVDLLERLLHGRRPDDCRRDVHRPELRAEPAAPHARDVGVQALVADLRVALGAELGAQVGPAERGVGHVREALVQRPRQVVVPVEQRVPRVQREGARLQRRRLILLLGQARRLRRRLFVGRHF